MEEVYQLIFPSKLGRAAKPFRLLYGAQLIKQKYGWSDGCRGAYSANHIFAAFCMHINPKEKYKNRSFACKLFNDKEKQYRGNSIYERTLCDILRTRDESDSETIRRAMISYSQLKHKDVGRLVSYVDLFKVMRTCIAKRSLGER